MQSRVTLTQYLLQNLADHPEQKGLVLIMSDLATIGKYLSRETNRAGIANIRGSAGHTNVQNEQVQTLDVLANDLCKDFLKQTGHFAALASEEEEGVVDMGQYGKDAKYVIAFDPLDGSSNIDVNVSIGTIFSVHRRLEGMERTDEKQFLQKGKDQVLAGYILYGTSTVLIFSFGNGVHEFTLDQSLGEFLLSNERMMVPSACEIYSVNEGNTPYISEKDKKFIEFLKFEKKCSTRYIGSLVADFHRNMMKGGIYLYPGIDKKGTGTFEGKLRLNYEAKPMAFLIDQAGGLAIDGKENILDMQPTKLHQRCPLIVGNRDVVEDYLNF